MQLSFRKLLGDRFASSRYFCPLRYRVKYNYISLYRAIKGPHGVNKCAVGAFVFAIFFTVEQPASVSA
ncbi:hypothetical protein J3D43_001378 [Paenibacillus xylanexedens]|nr:hypothetical protein [Paenibacillus xylanexedens]